jgi:uncharacterized membrane protein
MLRRSFCVVLTAVVFGFCALPAAAKSYDFPNVQIDARVDPDGSLWITERRTFSFDGEFSWATYTLERHGWTGVTDVTVADEQGRYAATSTGAPRSYQVTFSEREMAVKWHFTAADEEKTFTIEYRVAGAVKRYRDTAELFWRFVGSDWEVPTRLVNIAVRIPGASRDDLRAWGHGPLNGVVDLHAEAVALRVEDLDPQTLVEARILFPASLVPGAALIDADGLARILGEEARLAREANLLRMTPLLNLALFPAALGAALLFWFILYLRRGKEHRIRLEQPYLREPPATYRPAILGALLRWGTPSGVDFAASIMDLARRGYVMIQQEGDDVFRFTRVDRPEASLSGSDHAALALLFRWAKGAGITDKEFRSASWRQGDAVRMFRAWQHAVEAEARKERFFDEESRRLQTRLDRAFPIVALGGIILTLLIIIQFRLWLVTGFVAFPLAAGFLTMLKGPLARRSVAGATHLAQWRAFRRFLRDFSTLEDAPPPAIALWEIYLPYAVSLGVADRVIRQFPKVYREQAATYSPGWYASTRGIGGSTRGMPLGNLSSLSRSISRSIAIASTPRSSSSGSGGGFSRSSSRSSGGSRGGGGSGGRAG